MAREHPTQSVRNGVRPIRGAQTRRAEAVEAPFVQSLIGEAPGHGLTGSQLFAAYRAYFTADTGLHISERSSSAPRRSHTEAQEQRRCHRGLTA